MANKQKYLYGPVPSRRLGLSCGIDIVPLKICTLDCIYCQLGKTTQTTTERKDYAPIGDIINELESALEKRLSADFITIGGSGEPTLHLHLEKLIEKIKNITKIPVAILTNATLLDLPEVRQACEKADVLLPSLDATDDETFRKINRPDPDINIDNLIKGLCTFREHYSGQIWLEIFLVEGINTSPENITRFRSAIDKIRPDKVHLNTAVRPTAELGVQKLTPERLNQIADQLGHDATVIADFAHSANKCTLTQHELPENFRDSTSTINANKELLSMLKRRPCSLDDICSTLEIDTLQAQKLLTELLTLGLIETTDKGKTEFYKSSQQ
ncbi:MAG: radical SAM protein [Planctomycetota bacterium]|jgi:wyosine [tRNA(Phe)-imidazoG37] synthetase (radical SAM superfamily)